MEKTLLWVKSKPQTATWHTLESKFSWYTVLSSILVLKTHDICHFSKTTSFLPWVQCVGSTAQRSLSPQISWGTRDGKHTGLHFQWEREKKTHSSTQKAENWRWSAAWWPVFSVGSGHTKLLQSGLEVTSNLNGSHNQRLPKLSQPGSEVSNSPNDSYAICMWDQARFFS